MVIAEVIAGEGAVLTRRLVEHGHVRLDAVLIDQPAKHLGRAVGAVTQKAGGIQIEAIHRAFYHAFCSQDLGLSDRGRRFDINDDPVGDIDQVVGGIGEERLPTMGSGPARCRIGR